VAPPNYNKPPAIQFTSDSDHEEDTPTSKEADFFIWSRSMAQSLPSINLPVETWVDIYAATGIVAGTKLIIQNTGSSVVKLVESATEPLVDTGYNSLPTREFFTNADANVGAWAKSKTGGSLQVEEA